MKNKKTIISSLIVTIATGTAWAVRGKFGHMNKELPWQDPSVACQVF